MFEVQCEELNIGQDYVSKSHAPERVDLTLIPKTTSTPHDSAALPQVGWSDTLAWISARGLRTRPLSDLKYLREKVKQGADDEK